MADKSKINWTEATWNPVTGCSKVSSGCTHCYAEREWNRLAGNHKSVYFGRKFTDVQCHPERLEQPYKWTKSRMIFVNSMSDLFHEAVPDEFIFRVLRIMRDCERHTFQVLTKRPERMKQVIEKFQFHHPGFWPVPNVWLGVTAEDQDRANERIPTLLQIPAAVKFISVEPMLGPMDISIYLYTGWTEPPYDDIINWVICGGESGPRARPMHPEWARSLRDQCQAAGVPYFFKQWGEWAHDITNYHGGLLELHRVQWMNNDGTFSPIGEGKKKDRSFSTVCRIGKKAAGRLLDGREWNEMPETL